MALFIKGILVFAFLLIVISLGRALFFLVHDRSGSNRSVTALTWRLGLSVLLLIILFIAFSLGWITPHPL